MRILSATIENFGPHGLTTVAWGDFGPLVALLAKNGTGKTFLQETPFATFYGSFPSRPGSLYTRLRHGQLQGRLEAEFEERGVKYRAIRRVRKSATGKTKEQEGELYLLETGEQLAGPKIGDYEAKLKEITGPEQVAAATWFAAQGGKGDLINIARSERRAVFGALLSFEGLDRLSSRFSTRASETNGMAKDAEARSTAESLEAIGRELEEAALSRDAAKDGRAKAEAEIATLEAEERQASEEAARLAAELKELDALAGKLSAAERAEKAAEGNAKRASALVETLTARAGEERRARVLVARRERVLAAEPGIAKREAAFATWKEWNERHTRLAGDRLAAERRVAELEAIAAAGGVTEETRELAAEAPKLRARFQEVKAKKQEAEAEARRLSGDLLRGRQEAARREVARIEGSLAKKPETPGDAATCATCPLLKEFAALPGQLEAAKERLATIGAELEANEMGREAAEAKVATLEAELEEIRAKGTRAAATEAKVKGAADTAKRLEEARGALQEAEARLRRCDEGKPAIAADPAAKRAQFARLKDALAMAPASLEAALLAAADLEDARKEQQEAERQHFEATAATAEAREAAANADIAADLLREQKATAERLLSSARAALKRTREEVTRHATTAARCEERMDGLRAKRAEVKERRERAAELRKKTDGLKTLARVYGDRGVQPILLDAALPAAERAINGVLRELTDGEMVLRIVTQSANADGSLKEDIAILVTYKGHEQDILEFSGGEKKLIGTAIRLGIALWQGNEHKRRAECLFVDEGFDALDFDNAARMVKVLHGLQRTHSQIVCITHDATIAARLPATVRLEGRFDGVDVIPAASPAVA